MYVNKKYLTEEERNVLSTEKIRLRPYCLWDFLILFGNSNWQEQRATYIEIFIINMNNESFNKIIGMNGFFSSLIIFMSIIPECNIFTIIVKNTRLSYSRFTRITNNIFNSRFNITCLNFRCMNIETIINFLKVLTKRIRWNNIK